MSSGRSNSESISECEFEITSESNKESICGCYNNEPEYSHEEIILRIHTKSSMYYAVHVTKSEANKILEVFCLWQCQLFFSFIMYNGFIFDEKGVFYILTAFSFFRENVSINFEHKNFQSLIML